MSTGHAVPRCSAVSAPAQRLVCPGITGEMIGYTVAPVCQFLAAGSGPGAGVPVATAAP
jgi:hypothetical protein